MSNRLERKLYKVDPKIRMIANGDEVVNTLRAEQAPAVAVQEKALKELDLKPMRDLQDQTVSLQQIKDKERRHLEKVPQDVYVDVFIKLKGESEKRLKQTLAKRRIRRMVQKSTLVSAEVPLSELQDLVDDPEVISVEIPEQIRFNPPLDVSHSMEGPAQGIRRIENAPPHQGKVLIGIIDVQGFDFAHPDFLDENGQTRFVAIWDQGGDSRPAPKAFGYGSEIKKEHMHQAMAAEKDPAIGLSATVLEPQSQMVPSSHGTHVASIAAGNLGVCNQAYIAGVLISLPGEDMDRRKSFYDSSRIAHAVDYLFELGKQLEVPVSINVSLGTNGHAHDASSMTSRWIDYELATAGRSVCVAAGNAGQEAPASPDDWGFVMGRIHTGGRVQGEQPVDIEWVVVGNGIADLSENEMEIWYNPGDRFSVQVKPPRQDWLPVLKPGEYIENQMLDDGTFISVYNELYRPANGFNYISCYLSPRFSSEGIVGIQAGTWIIRLQGIDLRDGGYHAWIERDDPRRMGRTGMLEAWRFPSFFSLSSNVDNTSVSSLACGNYIISVANLDESNQRINISSSQGPTRDGREKPEIAAPGTGIVAANGFGDHVHNPWISMSGTSMASPYVAGLVGLLLASYPELTAAQIGGIIRRTAQPLITTGFDWQNDAGFGCINPVACLQEVERMRKMEDRTQ
jgi:subtilisin family serine protease